MPSSQGAVSSSPHSCGPCPSVFFFLASFLSTSPDLYRPSVTHMPLSSPISTRTRQFCRPSLGCLSPGKFNCSTSAESDKYEIFSWSQRQGLYIAMRAFPLGQQAPPVAEVCVLTNSKLALSKQKCKLFPFKSKHVTVYKLEET